MEKKIKILILGGGFSGIKSVHELYKNKNIEITLITNEETFRYGATIWRAATGYLKETSYIPIRSLIPNSTNVRLVLDKVSKIDRINKKVLTESNKDYSYDYCIIGLGNVTSYFGIEGLEKYSYSIKSSSNFDKFRTHLHDELIKNNQLDKNYVVVGAGPTGVELAAALKTYLKTIAKHHNLKSKKVNIDLIEAAPRILPSLLPMTSNKTHKRLKKLGIKIYSNHKVESESAKSIQVNGRSIPTETVIWTAGVTNNPFFIKNNDQFTLNKNKKVIVDDHLKVDPYLFVIGDSADTKFSGLALTALHNARYVAKIIKRELDNKSTPAYLPLKPITIIPVGKNWSVLQWRNFVISGRVANFFRILEDFVGYSEIVGIKKAYNIWLKRNKKHEDCPICCDDSTNQSI